MNQAIALVDLSYLFKRAWHGQPMDATPGHAAHQVLKQLSRIRETHSHAIVCLDSPPYRRTSIDPNYKAHREKPTDEELSQKRWLLERIDKDGYSVAKAKGYEADDIIATLTTFGYAYVIVASDKDMAQLVCDHVTMLVPGSNERQDELRGPEEIKSKYGVGPQDMRLWLALVGDDSDNIPGVPGIGPKKASELIHNCVNMVGISQALADASGDPKRGKMWDSLATHWEQLQVSYKLTALEYDAPIDAQALLVKREQQKIAEDDVGDMADDLELMGHTEEQMPEGPMEEPPPPPKEHAKTEIVSAAKSAAPAKDAGSGATGSMAKHSAVTEDLQPLDINSAYRLATAFYNGRLYSKFHSAEAIFTVIVKARELGLKVTTALDGFHIIEGKPSPSADMIRALAMRHPDCEYFRLIENSQEKATWETKNRRNPEPTRYTYTIEEARQAGMRGGNWGKRDRQMLAKTCSSILARLEYPLATLGFYCPEEFGEVDQ